MPFDLAQVLRIKGMIDATVEQAPGDRIEATPALVGAYGNVRQICIRMVADTDAAPEFELLFPPIELAVEENQLGNPIYDPAQAEQARLLLAQLGAWLGSWPSAEDLLDEMIAALDAAEAEATEPAEKERLAGLLEGLRGSGRQIAVNVVSAYLERVHL